MGRIAIFFILVVAMAAPLFAADGRTPIYTLPLVIDQPGSYYLTRDLVYGSGTPAIDVQADDVQIDFNGHRLEMQQLGFRTIELDGNYTNLEIHGGTIIGGNIGIYARNTVGDDFSIWIHDMRITGALNQGIWVEGQSLLGSSIARIENNIVQMNGDDGIYLRFMWNGLVAGNAVSKNTDGSASSHGIYLNSARNVVVRDNVVSHFSGDGIRVWYSWYCTLEGNQSSYNSLWGTDIYQGINIVYRNNRTYGNGSGGMDVPGGEGHVNSGGNYP